MLFKIKLAIAAFLLIGAFTSGFKVASWRADAAMTGALITQKENYEDKLKEFNKRVAKSEDEKATIAAKYAVLSTRLNNVKDIPDCTIGPDALSVWNSASN